ncbi:SDR family NAD(P)-dependent oxidoreductase [Nonomuraea aurantiaca]|uniref:SDR family NAD(P)-dependent oxidoreductase n=1 Tax=Nonomuraea aurantiaca TaxID=2878562 RepID=UPI001CD9A546|nr:SDR family oxidoreductase [Nonomuraea aurantiaca]MCA2226280.1 SDR family oxidoreductase [Nonomuraea aurantiaca]
MSTHAPEAGQSADEPPHAVVTGASSGIGQAIAARLLSEGWRVTGMSRTRPPECEQETSAYSWIEADLTDLDQLAGTSASVGAVDAVVHAAGVQRSAPLGGLSAQDGALMWRVHVEAATVLVNALAGAIRPGGRVVLIGSRTMAGAAGKSQYAATKAALAGLSRSWAMELAPRGITVNVVAPGPTDTPMLRDPGRAATPPRVPPLGRFIRPEEVAGLTAFLLGPEGGSVTGQHLVMCGGASL